MKKNQLCHLFLILLFLTTSLSCTQKKLAVKQLIITTKEGQTYSIDAEIARTQEERFQMGLVCFLFSNLIKNFHSG